MSCCGPQNLGVSAGCDMNLIFTATDECGDPVSLVGKRIQFGMKRDHDDKLSKLVVYKDSDVVSPVEIEVLPAPNQHKARIKILGTDTEDLEEGLYCCSVDVDCVRAFFNFIQVSGSMFHEPTP